VIFQFFWNTIRGHKRLYHFGMVTLKRFLSFDVCSTDNLIFQMEKRLRWWIWWYLLRYHSININFTILNLMRLWSGCLIKIEIWKVQKATGQGWKTMDSEIRMHFEKLEQLRRHFPIFCWNMTFSDVGCISCRIKSFRDIHCYLWFLAWVADEHD